MPGRSGTLFSNCLRSATGKRATSSTATQPLRQGVVDNPPGPLIGKNGILARDGIRNSTQRCAAGQDRSAESRDDRPGRGPLAGRPRRGVVVSPHRNAGVFAVATWQGGERPELRQGELLRR